MTDHLIPTIRLVGNIDQHRAALEARVDKEFNRVCDLLMGSPAVQKVRALKLIEAQHVAAGGELQKAPAIKLEAETKRMAPGEVAAGILANASRERLTLFGYEMTRMRLKQQVRDAVDDRELSLIQVTF